VKRLPRRDQSVTLLLSRPATSAQPRHDGHLWSALSTDLKVSYIQGLIDGSTLGASFVKEGLPNGACRTQVSPAYSKTAEKMLANVSPAQIADGVDTVFK
jgi:hypothetical protein